MTYEKGIARKIIAVVQPCRSEETAIILSSLGSICCLNKLFTGNFICGLGVIEAYIDCNNLGNLVLFCWQIRRILWLLVVGTPCSLYPDLTRVIEKIKLTQRTLIASRTKMYPIVNVCLWLQSAVSCFIVVYTRIDVSSLKCLVHSYRRWFIVMRWMNSGCLQRFPTSSILCKSWWTSLQNY